ncbi:MAG: PhzF family phenazine biosynthesis protein [Bacteroidales bacterium]|jgi:PhzF family phenazine biosynthesis protein
MKKTQIIYQVDAFTSKPFKGNPAGVCILEKEPSEEWMQNIAMEMNLPETAFVFHLNGIRNIRFFTPEAEMKLCGHATLSASHILFETGMVKKDEPLELISRAGKLITRKDGDWITMNFPIYTLDRIPIPGKFSEFIGVDPLEIYKAGFGWTLALLRDEEQVRTIKPDFALLRNSEFGDLIITAPSSDPAFDFCVRCFAPAVGINEDPVTGSAHCALVPFWSARTGRQSFNSHQVSKREGVLKVSLKGERVEISGQACTVFKAELTI